MWVWLIVMLILWLNRLGSLLIRKEYPTRCSQMYPLNLQMRAGTKLLHGLGSTISPISLRMYIVVSF